MKWCLDVSRSWDGTFDKDDVINKAVGKEPGDSGAGMGVRDLGYWFDNEADAMTARERVRALPFFVTTNVWSSV